jgi:hypothetical protein
LAESGEKLAAPQNREFRQRPIVFIHMKIELNTAGSLALIKYKTP